MTIYFQSSAVGDYLSCTLPLLNIGNSAKQQCTRENMCQGLLRPGWSLREGMQRLHDTVIPREGGDGRSQSAGKAGNGGRGRCQGSGAGTGQPRREEG